MATEEPRFQPRRAIRLIFEYEGDTLRLVAQQSVEMVVAESAADPSAARTPGYYLDARDAAERTLARAPARGAFGRSAEVFPERHEDPIQRIDVEQPRGAFTVTLPAIDAADHVTMVRIIDAVERTAGVERAQPRVVDVASFKLGAT
jgi:hypothetical protein